MARVLKAESIRITAASRLLPSQHDGAPRVQPRAHLAAPPASTQAAPVTPPVMAITAVDLEEELGTLRRQAHSDGFEAGRRDAHQQIEAAIARQEAMLRQAIDAMDAGLKRHLRETEQFAVAVAYEACARVLTEAAVDERGILATVQRLLEHSQDTSLLRVQLPPAHVESVRHHLAADPHWQHRALQIEADPSLSAGECRVVSSHGQVETSLGVQLDAIRESLLATFAERQR